MNRTTSLLTRFLAISIALHACLFAGLGQMWLMMPNLNLGESVLEIHFPDYTSSSAKAPSSKLAMLHPIVNNSATRAIPPEKSTSGSASPISVADTGSHATAPTTEIKDSLHNHLLGVLRTRLSQYLTYPPQARHRGWEGTVLLSLHVESDGELEKIRLERSSGYAVLDNSALNSLKRLGNLVEARAWLEGRSIDMQLPVIYKLIDN